MWRIIQQLGWQRRRENSNRYYLDIPNIVIIPSILILFFYFLLFLCYIFHTIQQTSDQSPMQTSPNPNNNNSSDQPQPEQNDEEKKRIAELEKAMRERPPSYYQYKLVGILVHRGTSDSGHYYSFIKVNYPSYQIGYIDSNIYIYISSFIISLQERLTQEGKQPRWVEFNDKVVRSFDPKVTRYPRNVILIGFANPISSIFPYYSVINDYIEPTNQQDIADECFGGTETVIRYDTNTKQRREEVVGKSR